MRATQLWTWSSVAALAAVAACGSESSGTTVAPTAGSAGASTAGAAGTTAAGSAGKGVSGSAGAGKGGASAGAGGSKAGTGGAGAKAGASGSAGAKAGAGGAGKGGAAGTAGTGTGDPPWVLTGNKVCDNCLESQCFALLDYCPYNAECKAFMGCIGQCGKGWTACKQTCLDQTKFGYYSDLVTCLEDLPECTTECGVTFGTGGATGTGGAAGTAGAAGGDGCGLLAGSIACTACQDQKCCSQAMTCANEPDCIPMINCIRDCASGDTACETACEMKYPKGGVSIPYIDCLYDSCPPCNNP